MDFAIIRTECGYRKGGAERYAANFCQALALMGHKVWVLAARCDANLHPNITHVPIAVNGATSSSRTKSFHRNSQKALLALPVDAVFALSRSYPSDAFRVSDPLHEFWMKIRYPNPIHRFLQTLNPRHREILNLERAIFEPYNTRFIVTNSQLSKKIIDDSLGFPQERIHVIYNGVDHTQFFPANRPIVAGQEVQLLFVGQDFKRKGLAPLIRALAQVKRSGVRCRLRVVGRDRPGPYEKLAADLKIADQVDFEGPTRGIEEAYRAADLLVFPTLYDPFANVCLEALACGVPVLTTTTNGASEVISEGIDGYVVAGQVDGLADRLAEKIARFCELDVTARRGMGGAAARKAAGFTIEGNARAVVEVLTRGQESP